MRISIIYTISLLIGLFMSIGNVFAQTPPYITSIDKNSASTGEALLIVGLNFPTNIVNLSIKFGGANVPQSDIISTSATLIEVKVPANATLNNVSVTDTSTGLTAYSNEVFNINHGGSSFSTGDIDGLQTFSTSSNFTFDICMCDFDNNGSLDIVTTNQETNSINIFTNNSTTAALSFSKNDIDLGVNSVNVTCGDLNGDGKSDLIVTRGGSGANSFYIFTNNSPGASTVSFGTPLIITLPPQPNLDVRSPKRPVIQDMDLDGKPDLILTNTADNNIFIYKNNSSGSILFDTTTPTQITITGVGATAGLDVKDLNNDGFPEIICVEDQAPNVVILPNNSQAGTITMGDQSLLAIGAGAALRNVKSGDLDLDGFNDLVISSTNPGLQNAVTIVRNASTVVGGPISFDSPIISTDVTLGFGVDLFDAEGDGDLDIAVASLNRSVYILLNTNPGDLSQFQTETIDLSEFVRNIQTGDINGDGKPDLMFTYESSPGSIGRLGVLTNRNCVVPVITPNTDRTICNNTTIRLEATGALDATYDWKLNGGSIQSGPNNFLDVTGTAGSYTVTLSDGLSCGLTSSPIVITLGTDPSVVTNANSSTGGSPVCVGTDVTLTTDNIVGATYSWTGPNGYTSSSEDPVLSNITADMTGTYTVIATANGCTSNESSTTVLIESVPVISVNNSTQDIFCLGSSIQLSATTHAGSYTYSWNESGTPITPSETNTTITITTAGDYSAVIKSSNDCTFESEQRSITTVPVPVSAFTISDAGGILTAPNTSICKDLVIDFVATSTDGGSGSGLTINNAWVFADGTTDSGSDNISHTYTVADDYIVTLTATYPDVDNCTNTGTTESTSQTITITNIPNINITQTGGTVALNGDIEKCPSGTVSLSIPDTFSNYIWSSGESTDLINVLTPGTFSVSATDQFGCSFTTSDTTVANFTSSGIDIASTSATVPIDETTRRITVVEGQLSVELTVENAVDGTVAWTPSSLISDTTLTTVTVFIQDINTLVTVFGDDAEGCMESDTVRLINPNIRAKKVFSPNGDGIGDDCWEITNSRSTTEFAGCDIFIFDTKGRLVEEMTGPFIDDCVWDGNINGSPAPEGVYYYVLKCSGENLSLSGSILLGR